MAKKLLIGSVILFALGIVGLVVAISMLDLNKHKPKIEQIALEASGYSLKINGDISVSFAPVGIKLKEISVSKPNEKPFTTLKELSVAIKLIPFLKQNIEVDYVVLSDLNLHVEKLKNGKFNFELAKKEALTKTTQENNTTEEKKQVPLININEIRVENTNVEYIDTVANTTAKVTDMDVVVNSIVYDTSKKELNAIAFLGDVKIKNIAYQKYNAKDLHVKFSLKNSIANVNSMSYNIFDSVASGKAKIDLSTKTPKVEFAQNIPKLKLKNFSKEILEKDLLDGELNLDVTLATILDTPLVIKKNLKSEVIFDGQGIGIIGYDLDKIIGGYDKSQSVDMVDIGSLLVAGPIGFALSKSSDASTVYSGAKSGQTLLKHLHVKIDVANAKAKLTDVAIATGKNRVALKGDLDIVNEKFLDVKVGVLDAKNCAKYSQTIIGTFSKPSVKLDESAVNSIVNMASSLFGSSKKVLGADTNKECTVFYNGAVKQP